MAKTGRRLVGERREELPRGGTVTSRKKEAQSWACFLERGGDRFNPKKGNSREQRKQRCVGAGGHRPQ